MDRFDFYKYVAPLALWERRSVGIVPKGQPEISQPQRGW